MSHTPGPWKANGNCVDTGRGAAPVACAYDPDDHNHVNEICKANARLIAAAPDLLAACKAAEPYVFNCPFENALTVHAMLEAAIAKAEGQA